MTARQRKAPVAAVGRTRGKRHQGDVRFGRRRRTERQLYEVQLTWELLLGGLAIPTTASLPFELRYRPIGAGAGFRDGRPRYLES